MGEFQEKIIALSPAAKKELFDTLLEGDIVVGVDENAEGRWQIIGIPLVFKAESLAQIVR